MRGRGWKGWGRYGGVDIPYYGGGRIFPEELGNGRFERTVETVTDQTEADQKVKGEEFIEHAQRK